VDELWSLHEKVIGELVRKVTLEKAILDERLQKLHVLLGESERHQP